MGSHIPKAQPDSGPLPASAKGIEFTTDVPPDNGCAPGRPMWSGPRDGVRIDTDDHGREFAEISVVNTKNMQT